jgi:TolA-binding protein
MKVRNLIAMLVLGACCAWAQSTMPQTPAPGGQTQTGAGSAPSSMPPRQGPGAMQQMHMQHMQQMQQTITQMQQLLDKMKSDVKQMDPKGQAAMQDNIQMWSMIVQHLQQMRQHMEQMGPGGMGMRGMRPGYRMRMPGGTGPTQPPPPPPPPAEPPK